MASKYRVALNYSERMDLVKEHEDLLKNIKHLEYRHRYFESQTDPGEARKIEQAIKNSQDRIKEILEKLSF
jgi:hypothetical protein